MTTFINQYLILNNSNYFEIADEFVLLEQLFKKDTIFEKLTFWIDMIIYPIINIISIIIYNQRMNVFTIMAIHKTITKWNQYIRYAQIKTQTDEWKEIIQSTGGPVISTNDEKYIMYVYADAMQRLRNRLFDPILTKKSTERLQ